MSEKENVQKQMKWKFTVLNNKTDYSTTPHLN